MQDITIGNLTEDNDQLEGELIASKDQLDLLETRKQVEQLMEEVKCLKAGLVVAKKKRAQKYSGNAEADRPSHERKQPA
jgi:hypothetical protein